MKKILLIAAALFCCISLVAEVNDDKPVKQSLVVPLYPTGQASGKGIVENGVEITKGPGEDNLKRGPEVIKDDTGKVSGVGDGARMEIYLPENPSGLMVVVCAGGSYSSLSAVNEGYCAVEWLLTRGAAVCNLFYRMPYGHKTIPLTDVQNAFRYLRRHADEWSVQKIGIMGFSAGGHLAACASTMYVDDVTRPDFAILCYPVISMDYEIGHDPSRNNLLGENPSSKDIKKYSLQNRVDEKTPPTLLALSANDNRVNVQNSILYFNALLEKGVKAQMYIYPIGGHGWGFGAPPYTAKDKLGTYRKVLTGTLARFLQDQTIEQ